MQSRPEYLIQSLQLRPHPEGGHYGEIHRSTLLVSPADGRRGRAALTSIYFLLADGELSRWHRLRSDEAWHFLEGDPLELFSADAAFEAIETTRLGPYDGSARPLHVIERGQWQAARSTGAYTLVGCTVGPGFDYGDFQLLRDLGQEAAEARQKGPLVAAFI
ncbi:MAG TPA: cupin domain-containing protein [Rhodothermales bacterium]